MKKVIMLLSLCLVLVMMITSCAGNAEGETGDKSETESMTVTESGDKAQGGEMDPYEAGLQYKADGKYDEAEASFKTVIENDPENYLSYMELAEIYIRRIEFAKAYDILNKGYDVTGNENFKNKLLDFNSANVIKDSDGNLKGKSHFVDGKLSWYHEYVNDDETGLRKCVIYYGADESEISRVDIKYDGDNKPLTTYAYYTHTGEIEKIDFEYNAAGQIARTNEYTVDGVLLGYSVNEFDADGFKIKESRYNADGSEHWTLEYIHDTDALESKCLTYFYGKLVGESNKTYGENGYSIGGSSRFKGSFDRMIDYDFDYESNHEREELFEGDITYARIICYCAKLSVIY